MTTTTLRTRAGGGRIALAALVAAVLTSAVDAAIAVIAVAAGVPQTMQLMPATPVSLSVLASIFGAIGWTLIDRRAKQPRRVIRVLAPILLVVSFVPDAILAAATVDATGLAPVLTLASMHVTTIAIAIAVFARLIPLKRSSTP
ncbi:DUF6069 family protein [uncultured Amnibacterium sp.]|uniref:DUF6069 family protein n=1 Tax=uncultured Amnibacterium sp. TaxID=1631851 RepID=UPI0035CB9641